ncbi:Upstream stimulatory factor 2 [Amphibalanus amphitrite]|uniref:Upstream stimulatory factor 2 n=1 Tax=Amphibalanus amphitrite TaxID=1232801 RepID=A0A6A4WFK3_AMPAM|nr:Upstream stimulatory factor 2 [Amphibalanus amphitrite]
MQLQYFKAGGAPPGKYRHAPDGLRLAVVPGMTYRVVHINTGSGGGGEVVQQSLGGAAAATTAAVGGGGGAQGLLGATATGAEVADAQMAYIPSGTTAGDQLATLSATGSGGFYVISSPQEVTIPSGGNRTGGRCELHRDDRRRATHNEVERRRRDKINSWITKLAKLLPDNGDAAKQNQSKGAVLSQACDYVQDTRGMQQKYMDLVRDNEKLLEDIKMLKQSNEALVTANQLLKAHLKSQGAVILDADQAASGSH